MFDRILVVCDGNICRSPTAAAILASHLPDRDVSSAGLIGLIDQDMDAMAREVASSHGVNCPPHRGRRLDKAMCREADLILVMERRQRDEVMKLFPGSSGKVFLLSHWCGGDDIPDPYRRDRTTFEHVYESMNRAVAAWIPRL